MNPVLKKLQFKGQSPVLVLNAPAELRALAAEFGVPVDDKPGAKKRYPFVLAFARSLDELDAVAKTAAKALEEDGIFWSAYPKGTSKKYGKSDLNRDTGHERMGAVGFDGVSLVALDADWSAMRFKRMG